MHQSLTDILKNASGSLICSQIEDHYYLEKRNYSSLVDNIIRYHKMICKDLQLRLDDTLKLRSCCETREEYETLLDLTTQMAVVTASEYLPVLEQEYPHDEAVKILNDASKQVLNMEAVALAAQ